MFQRSQAQKVWEILDYRRRRQNITLSPHLHNGHLWAWSSNYKTGQTKSLLLFKLLSNSLTPLVVDIQCEGFLLSSTRELSIKHTIVIICVMLTMSWLHISRRWHPDYQLSHCVIRYICHFIIIIICKVSACYVCHQISKHHLFDFLGCLWIMSNSFLLEDVTSLMQIPQFGGLMFLFSVLFH
jgi:hypothetical protein